MEHRYHILIVDDDREICNLIASYLRKNSLRTTEVADGCQMWNFLATTPVDFIIPDVMMSGADDYVGKPFVLCEQLVRVRVAFGVLIRCQRQR
ncbi:response regulator [Salmonella enterica]|nr:response regulator [Salmonella enterica]EMD3918228.1 response regulator [Salmonella enterica]